MSSKYSALVFLVYFWVVFQTDVADCGKILAVVATPSYSHQVALWPIWRALSERGHQVTLITSDPDPSATNIKQIDISNAYEVMRNNDITTVANEKGMFEMLEFFIKMGKELAIAVFENEEIKSLIADKNQQFDVVITELWNGAILSLVHRFNTSFIGVSTLEAPPEAHACLGDSNHPILYPNIMLPFFGKLNFFERVASFLFMFYEQYLGAKIHSSEDETVRQYLGEGYPPVSELFCKMDMIFANADPIFHSVRASVPAVVNIGGALHIKKPKPLPKDLQEYLDGAKEGVIYFSLGSNVKSKNLTPAVRKVILETLAELPYKVLWKFEDDELPGKPDNVKISKWLPQQDVLRHPNVKLFITQGGLQSIDEAIYNKIPMVGMPFFGDQQNNVKKLENKGICLFVDHFNLEKESFKATILEVIENPKYKNRITELADLVLDQPMTGVEKAVWWTEYVIRHKGAKHLRGPAADLPLYQFYLLDVIGFLVAVLGSVTFASYKILKLSCKLIRNIFGKTKIKTN